MDIMLETNISVQEQVDILMQALRTEISTKPGWTIKEIKDFRANVFGKVKAAASETSFAGTVGEIIIYRGVKRFFSDMRVRQKYGYEDIIAQVSIILPAEIGVSTNFNDITRRAIEDARRIFEEVLTGGEGGASITDFFWQRGAPVEVKSRIYERVYLQNVGKRRREKTKHPFKADIPNEYAKAMTSRGNEFIVGWTWMNVIYEEITTDEMEKWKRKIGNDLLEITKKMQQTTGVPIKLTTMSNPQTKKEVQKLFKAIGYEVLVFLPTAVDANELSRILSQKTDLAEKKIDGLYVPEFIERLEQARRIVTPGKPMSQLDMIISRMRTRI